MRHFSIQIEKKAAVRMRPTKSGRVKKSHAADSFKTRKQKAYFCLLRSGRGKAVGALQLPSRRELFPWVLFNRSAAAAKKSFSPLLLVPILSSAERFDERRKRERGSKSVGVLGRNFFSFLRS